MKIRYIISLFCIVLSTINTTACPTCVGRITKRSAPFFSDDCYKSKQTLIKKSTKKQSDKKDITTTQIPGKQGKYYEKNN